MTYDSVRIITTPSTSVHLLEIRHDPDFVSVWCERWGRWWNKEQIFWWVVLMTLLLGPFFICQSAKCHYTFLSPSYLLALLSITWKAQTTPHQETNDNCQSLSRKTQVGETNWHLSPLVYWTNWRRWEHSSRQLDTITLSHSWKPEECKNATSAAAFLLSWIRNEKLWKFKFIPSSDIHFKLLNFMLTSICEYGTTAKWDIIEFYH